MQSSDSFGSNLVNNDVMQSPNIGPRAQRHYNKNKQSFGHKSPKHNQNNNNNQNNKPNNNNNKNGNNYNNTNVSKTDDGEYKYITDSENINIDLENDDKHTQSIPL